MYYESSIRFTSLDQHGPAVAWSVSIVVWFALFVTLLAAVRIL